MSLSMPAPIRIGNIWYLRVRVPSELKQLALGRKMAIPVKSGLREVVVRDFVKVSLGTHDPKEAKHLFATAYASVHEFWEMLRNGPKPLSQKQMLGLAGEIRMAFIEAFDENPGDPLVWQRVIELNDAAATGRSNPLTIPTPDQRLRDIDLRIGGITDAVLRKKSLMIDGSARPRLLSMVLEGLSEAARINQAKADGDYSDSGVTSKYPRFDFAHDKPANHPLSDTVTFDSVITKEAERRASGKTAVPLRGHTEKKYRTAVSEFAEFRGSDDLVTVTARQADGWVQSLLDAEELANSTIKQRLQNVGTVIEWAREQSLGELFPHGNPLALVKPPSHQSVPSSERAYTLDEARRVLKASRKENMLERRWLPWLCAYSGARINEVAQLTPKDFFQVEDLWFYRLTTMGGKTLKTLTSERRVPVHADLINEGLIEFVTSLPGKSAARIFRPRSQSIISEWLRGELKIDRVELAPNHGWRHLFEDLCLVGGVRDSAKNYITGRTTGASGEGYGKSQAMLPGLAAEMAKVPSYIKS